MKVNKTKLYLSMVELHKTYLDCDLIFIELFELNYWIPVASTETIVDESRLIAILCTGFQYQTILRFQVQWHIELNQTQMLMSSLNPD